MLEFNNANTLRISPTCVDDDIVGVACLNFSRSYLAIAVLTGFALTGCGGNQNDPPKENTLSQHVVSTSEIPALIRRVDQLSTALRKQPNTTSVGLHSVAGTYQGETSDGRLCSLMVDEDHPGFQFQVEREKIGIHWEPLAYAANGAVIHNLEDSSAPGQPGVQLTRFTNAPIPMTEVLILRIGTGTPALPQMIYLRTQGSTTKTVKCIFERK
ncbi:hypothetical protein [Solimicrobium silvestre]|uniref:Uncharacterized protein n=1 Tax=Solimicrobium silvestre TaxID=2099400 RepID=A0A2S9GZ19_9BURK|nr:hypothetical protein [Solimicrobium silvestre]PRC92979.1 hypothetical protein S2091_2396 [Solimicrobium silvestre]